MSRVGKEGQQLDETVSAYRRLHRARISLAALLCGHRASHGWTAEKGALKYLFVLAPVRTPRQHALQQMLNALHAGVEAFEDASHVAVHVDQLSVENAL